MVHHLPRRRPRHGRHFGVAAALSRKIPALLTEREDLTAEYISALVRQGVKSMPFFRKTEIGNEDLAALNLYLVKPPAGD